MKFHFYSPSHFEKWDYRNPLEQGIGGSETAHIEVAIGLAKRGHEVLSYSPLPKDLESQTYRGVRWFDLKEADFTEPGIWVIGRSPQTFDKFKKKLPNQKVWLVMQDTHYPQLTKSRALKCDIFLPLCETHLEQTQLAYSYVKDRIIKSANAIRSHEIIKIEKENIERDPYRIMYASSPDRGLVNLIKIFPRIKEQIPQASLHIFYGFDNIRKYVPDDVPFDRYGNTINEVMALASQEGIFWHGRIGQLDLYREWFKSGIWGYPTAFSETSCITSMEAQACGAIPITNPFWALKDNVMEGSFIDGDPHMDSLTRQRYIEEIIFWMRADYYMTRETLMKKARERFDWSKIVDQYEKIAYDTE